jgi:hypothetical protein
VAMPSRMNRQIGERLTDASHAVTLYPSSAHRALGVAIGTHDAVAYLALEPGGRS